jgi:competence protein ComGF
MHLGYNIIAFYLYIGMIAFAVITIILLKFLFKLF